MRAIIFAALALVAGQASADAVAGTIDAALIDCFSTGEAVAGISRDAFHEANPVGALRACALKVPLIFVANRLPEPDRTFALDSQRSAWDGVGAHNLALLAGASSAAATGIGLIAFVVVWEHGADERAFKEQCMIHEALAGRPLTCIYKPTQPQ